MVLTPDWLQEQADAIAAETRDLPEWKKVPSLHPQPKKRERHTQRRIAYCKACGAEKDDGFCRFCPGPPAEVIELRDL